MNSESRGGTVTARDAILELNPGYLIHKRRAGPSNPWSRFAHETFPPAATAHVALTDLALAGFDPDMSHKAE